MPNRIEVCAAKSNIRMDVINYARNYSNNGLFLARGWNGRSNWQNCIVDKL